MTAIHYFKSKNRQKGSVSVEATLSLTIFVFFMISIICLINICRVQSKVSNALHLAALDISNISYLYYITGMYDADTAIQAAAEEAGGQLVEKIKPVDDVINNTETMLGLIGNSGKLVVETAKDPTQLSDALEELKIKKEDGYLEVESLKSNLGNIKEQAKDIAKDPVGFVKLMVQSGIGEGMDIVKNLLAGVFAQALMEDHISAGGTVGDVDGYLKSLGVEDGLSGMSFMASSLFAGDDNTDINLIVMYRVNIFPLFNLPTIPFAQSASTRAWLSGDVKTTFDLPEDKEESSEEPASRYSVWEQRDTSRGRELHDMFGQEKLNGESGFIPASVYSGYFGYGAETNTLYAGVSVDLYSKSYTNEDGSLKISGLPWKDELAGELKKPITFRIKGGGDYSLEDIESVNYEYFIYIPENATDEMVALLQQDVDQWMAENGSNLPTGIASLEINVVKIGGDTPRANQN